MNVQSAAHTYIGDEGTRGVSGGERRRVCIGVDIVHKPSLLFLDEPTSGLDSTRAFSVVEKVKDIAKGGSIVLSDHPPAFISNSIASGPYHCPCKVKKLNVNFNHGKSRTIYLHNLESKNISHPANQA